MKSGSNLEKLLERGEFVVTAELGPPRGTNTDPIKRKGMLLKDSVDAVNITDNQTAIVKMSSMAVAAQLCQMGIEPVMQMVTRDRNRIAMQSDIMGAAGLGIKNILCLSGDHQVFGNQKYARNVYDIDSIQLVGTVKRMRDRGTLLDSDEPLDGKPGMFIGAAAAPFSDPVEFRPFRLQKKIEAGADFIQTQCVYDIRLFKEYMKRVRDMGLHERCHILAGVMPLKSCRMGQYLSECVPGVVIPDSVMNRMESVPPKEAAREGIDLCCECIQELRDIEGVHGIHLMAIEWEHRVAEILECAGLLPRPQ